MNVRQSELLLRTCSGLEFIVFFSNHSTAGGWGIPCPLNSSAWSGGWGGGDDGGRSIILMFRGSCQDVRRPSFTGKTRIISDNLRIGWQ